jgi:glycosyltransferase involved in cell wall biosynthesis
MPYPLDSPVQTDNQEILRIGMFSESFDPVQNGVATSVLTLIAALRAQNNHVYVFAPAHQQQREMQTYVMRFPSFVSALNREYPLAYPFLPRLALETHFNDLRLHVVHTHTPFVMGLTGANLALQRNVPLVATFHTLYAQYSHYVPFLPDTVTQALIEHYIPWYYNRCAEVICPSKTAAAALRGMGVTRHIEVIPTGIPLPSEESISNKVRNFTREGLGIDHCTPLLLYAGRLAREKNLDLLLEVFARVCARLPLARLAIAGGGPHAEDLQQQVREMELTHAVLFLGSQRRCDMDALYAAADVFCFPSPTETQGLVIGEARAAGTPCVVIDAGGAPETVRNGEDGFRVSPDNAQEFAMRILQILEDRDFALQMRSNARKNARNFTPERMVERVIEVYDRARHQNPPTTFPSQFIDDMNWEFIGKTITRTPPV